MMKDFKRLHYTDFKECDGNDSDGGYSDYSNPEQPAEKPPQKEVEVELTPGITQKLTFWCSNLVFSLTLTFFSLLKLRKKYRALAVPLVINSILGLVEWRNISYNILTMAVLKNLSSNYLLQCLEALLMKVSILSSVLNILLCLKITILILCLLSYHLKIL